MPSTVKPSVKRASINRWQQSRLDLIADKKLRQKCEKLVATLNKRKRLEKRKAPSRPDLSAKNVLLKSVYRQTRKYIELGAMAVVDAAVMAVAQCKKVPADSFESFLLLVEACRANCDKADRNRIRLHARALSYANQKSVPPEYVIGFIHQEGGLKRIARVSLRKDKTG